MIRLAVMSDLHVGLAARSKDLCPKPAASSRKDLVKYNGKIEDAYRQKFVDFIHENKITADYLILPGDLTNDAQPQEVKIVSEFILQVADALHVLHNKIVFVPGNHDVDWSVYDSTDETGVRWEQRYAPIGHDKFHFRQLIEQGNGDLFLSPHFTAWNFDDFLAIGYNSASHDSPAPKNVAHHGLADPDHLNEIRAYLESISLPTNSLRLFLVHHHSLDFANPLLRTPDFSLMTNAENLLSLLHEYDFDLLIHGHKHYPRFETHSTQTHPHLPILCSGSFSVEIDTQWAGTIGNQFHLVTVNDGRVMPENLITGRITSWTNIHARGWIPSEKSTSGIHHIIPFGSYVMPKELDARLEPFITEWLTHRNYILWSDIVEKFPDLEYLPLDSAIKAFERMAERLDRKVMHQTLKDLMLY